MWRVLCTFLPASALLLAGCFPTLYTDAPLGDTAVFEPSEWDGLWICPPDELRRVRTIDPDFKGPTLTKNWRDCNAAPANREELTTKFRRHGEWFFEDCAGRLATGKPCEYWIVARRLETTVTLYEADETRIRRLFDQGKVPGRIEFIALQGLSEEPREPVQRVVLHSLTADHYKVLLDPREGAFRPLNHQCIRLPAELDPCQQAK